MNTIETNIELNTTDLRGYSLPLYEKYPGQFEPQRAFIEIDCENGKVSAKSNPEIGNGVPVAVAYGRTRRIDISPYVDGDALAEFLESDEVLELLERIYQSVDIVWNGNNFVGRAAEDAELAIEKLELLARSIDESEYYEEEDED